MPTNLKEKNILYLTHSYNSFQKDPIEIASQYFNHVYVAVRYKPVAEIGSFLRISFFKPHRKQFAIQLHNLPSNVTVVPIPLWYLPTKSGYKNLGIQHYNKVLEYVENLNIKFDITHAHFTWTAGFVGAKLKEKFNKPFVLTVHEDDISLYEEIEDADPNLFWTWEMADKLLRVNKRTLHEVQKYNDNCEYIPEGYNSDLFYPMDKDECRSKLNLHKDRTILLAIGNLEVYKGHTYLIEAMKDVVKNHPDILLLIMGEGSLKNSLIKQIKDANLENNITLLGHITHDKVPVWINACDVFVMPSLAEGTPIVLFESLGCGKPFAGTNVSGMPEIIVSDDLGYLCNSKDPKGMAEVIEKALNKKWDSNYIVNYIRQFSLKKINDDLLRWYSELLFK